MDRNQRARDQFAQQQEVAKMRRQFAQAVAAGQVKVIDRFSNPIEVGSLVVWSLPHDFVWLVQDIKPVLDPNVQPGLVAVTLTATAPDSLCRVNSPITEMIVVGRQPTDGAPALTQIGETDQPEVVQPTEPTVGANGDE